MQLHLFIERSQAFAVLAAIHLPLAHPALRPGPPTAPCRSCLGAEHDAPSRRLRTKAAGEDVIRGELGPLSTIFKPSVVTGTEDRLFNMYATMAKRTPAMPLIDGGSTRMQPVWVRDVAAGGRAWQRGRGGCRVVLGWAGRVGAAGLADCGTCITCQQAVAVSRQQAARLFLPSLPLIPAFLGPPPLLRSLLPA
jgi:uncharacterized protein YbjT (DUF2867 family)